MLNLGLYLITIQKKEEFGAFLFPKLQSTIAAIESPKDRIAQWYPAGGAIAQLWFFRTESILIIRPRFLGFAKNGNVCIPALWHVSDYESGFDSPLRRHRSHCIPKLLGEFKFEFLYDILLGFGLLNEFLKLFGG